MRSAVSRRMGGSLIRGCSVRRGLVFSTRWLWGILSWLSSGRSIAFLLVFTTTGWRSPSSLPFSMASPCCSSQRTASARVRFPFRSKSCSRAAAIYWHLFRTQSPSNVAPMTRHPNSWGPSWDCTQSHWIFPWWGTPSQMLLCRAPARTRSHGWSFCCFCSWGSCGPMIIVDTSRRFG